MAVFSSPYICAPAFVTFARGYADDIQKAARASFPIWRRFRIVPLYGLSGEKAFNFLDKIEEQDFKAGKNDSAEQYDCQGAKYDSEKNFHLLFQTQIYDFLQEHWKIKANGGGGLGQQAC